MQFPSHLRTAPGTAAGTVRSFVDGLHDYMMQHRRSSFEKLRVDLPMLDSDDSKSESVSHIVMSEVERSVLQDVQQPLLE